VVDATTAQRGSKARGGLRLVELPHGTLRAVEGNSLLVVQFVVDADEEGSPAVAVRRLGGAPEAAERAGGAAP
jgi:hypothetical protein